MKSFLLACCLLFISLALRCQPSDPVLDSLKRPLPAGATARQQAERLQSVLWYIFRREEYSYERFPEQLDSIFQNYLRGKTGDESFEKRLDTDLTFFKASAIQYERPDLAKPMMEAALRQFETRGDSVTAVRCLVQLCLISSGLGDSLAFASYYDQTLKQLRHENDRYLYAAALNNIGIACYDFGRYADAAANYFESIRIIEQQQDKEAREVLPNLYYNIAGVYNRLDDTDNALIYVQKALDATKNTAVNPSSIYPMFGWVYLKKQNYQKALEAFSNQIIEENSFGPMPMAQKMYGMATCYRNLGNIRKAYTLAKAAVKLCPISTNAHYGSAAMQELASCEFELGLLDSALVHAQWAFQTFEIAKNNRGAQESAKLISDIYKKKGNYYEALKYSELRYKHQVLVERQLSTRQLAFGEFTRDNEVKNARREAEIEAQLTQQRNIRYALFAGLAVLTLLPFLLYNRFLFKQKTAEQLEAKNREVEAARARAEASEAFKSRFLANMSHEIRTPLHGISGYTELLLETSLSEKQRRYLNAVRHSNERLGEVVNDILDLSKLEAGEVRLRNIPFSPARIVHDVQDALGLRARDKGIELRTDIDADVPEAVLGDPTRLYQILMNLAGNAVKFTENGAVTVMVGASGSHPDNTAILEFRVQDTGIGIQQEKLAAIFDSFQQAGDDITARFGGTGLGLTIARDLVRLHGSDIQVESSVGQGSTFSFTLTLPLANAADLEAETAHGDDLYFSQALRILLADDNDFNREIASEALRRHFENVEITEAANGREAIERLSAPSFAEGMGQALVLMDMQMPEMTGTEAARYIRQHLHADIPIIALTASATPEEIDAALEAGMNRHLAKPFKAHELAQAIAETLSLEIGRKTATTALTELQNLEKPQSRHYDLRFLRDFCDGDAAQMQHFIGKFEAQYPLELEKLETALRQENREALYRTAHSFRPQLEFVGLREAAGLLQVIEQMAKTEPFDKISKMLIEIKLQVEPIK
ncbi:MAG TPA: ATP-binding protein [Saprospiraceae bacterium]|nr:ATP-binding protein [Saprospiraceae bacterium]